MAVIVGEQTFYYNVASDGNNLYSASYEFNMDPQEVAAKVFMVGYYPYAANEFPVHSYGDAFIASMKRQRSDGVIEEVDVSSGAAYDKKMTSVKYFFTINNGVIDGMIVINYWG